MKKSYIWNCIRQPTYKHTCVRVSWLSLISLISPDQETHHLLTWKLNHPRPPEDPRSCDKCQYPQNVPTWRLNCGFAVPNAGKARCIGKKTGDKKKGFEGWYSKPPTGFSMTAVLYRNEHHPEGHISFCFPSWYQLASVSEDGAMISIVSRAALAFVGENSLQVIQALQLHRCCSRAKPLWWHSRNRANLNQVSPRERSIRIPPIPSRNSWS